MKPEVRERIPEEEFPLIISQRDALRRHFEVYDSGRRKRTGVQQVTHGAQDRLRSR